MKAEVLHDVLEDSISGEGNDGRQYLGMSQLGKCPRRIFFDLVKGRQAMGPEQLRRCHEGLVHQADVIARIEVEGVKVINRDRELVGPWNGRFSRQLLGHIDGEIDGDLLEIKTLETWENLERIRSEGPRERDRAQCQAYMRYGGYYRALIVYKVRADGSTWVCWLNRSEGTGERLERKAEMVLQAIDDGEPPACECGRCRR